jgi:hypothetical protein
MGVARMLRPWRALVQEALPTLHGHQLNGLTDASWAMIRAEHCQLSRMAVATPGRATVPSRERRWQRLVANPRLDADAVLDRWATWALRGSRAVTLLLDETPQHNHLRAMKVSRMTGGRAVPLVWHTYRPDALPMPQDQLVLDLLKRTAAALPEGAKPTLMADRGLCWPAVVDLCVEHGWHFLLRAQGQTRVKLDGGTELSLDALVPGPGRNWCGQARVFKAAGWRRVNVVARWSPRRTERWLLVTDLPAEPRRCRQYRKRMRQEQSFRDEKSHGFRWNDSRIRDPAHAQRLLLVMALAMTWLICLGLRVIRRGQRHRIERPDRRSLSLFRLGLRFVQNQRQFTRPPPVMKSVGR